MINQRRMITWFLVPLLHPDQRVKFISTMCLIALKTFTQWSQTGLRIILTIAVLRTRVRCIMGARIISSSNNSSSTRDSRRPWALPHPNQACGARKASVVSQFATRWCARRSRMSHNSLRETCINSNNNNSSRTRVSSRLRPRHSNHRPCINHTFSIHITNNNISNNNISRYLTRSGYNL